MEPSEIVRKRQDDILKAFDDYIQRQRYFDIVYSNKFGYIWIALDETRVAGTVRLNTPEKMMDLLFNDVIEETIAHGSRLSHEPDGLTKDDKARVYDLIAGILEMIGDDKSYYLHYLNSYLNSYTCLL